MEESQSLDSGCSGWTMVMGRKEKQHLLADIRVEPNPIPEYKKLGTSLPH
jgi:hypothetical protein